MSAVFVVNAGSSSLKYRVIEVGDDDRLLASGRIERIGASGSHLADHRAAMDVILTEIAGNRIDAVGHRVVHGGDRYVDATIVDDDVEADIEALVELAPLHNRPGLIGIRAARAALPDLPHVAVFDTAFHAGLPPAARTYAIDHALAARFGIRRYGFHGTSYRYVSRVAAQLLDRPIEALRMIVLHLGNGASVAAIAAGGSVDTSMGLTPLEGLVMGTRSGDLDPAILLHLHRVAGMSFEDLDELLNRRSGILGLADHADMRDLVEVAGSGDARASLALDVYVHRLRHYIGAYLVELGGVDAIVFTAGVGENEPVVRERAVERLGFLGVTIDPLANSSASTEPRIISAAASTAAILVVPTNEELEIARQTVQALPPKPGIRLSGLGQEPRRPSPRHEH